MSKLKLSLACWNYDRTRALMDQSIQPDGIDLNYLNLPAEETFFRMLRHHEFDVSEMSLSSYVVSLSFKPQPFIAIPVFPSRSFRHSCIYVNAQSNINKPQDLIGKQIGNPEFQMTALVWIRGLLADEYDVPVNSVSYFTGGEEEPGRKEKLKLDLPPDIRIQQIGDTQTLSAMLENGDIDALYSARMPSSFRRNPDKVKRLFHDYHEIEKVYFQRTKIFPIMHTIVIRRELYEQTPWVAQSLYKAFSAAQKEIYEDLYQTAALKFMLPWLIAHAEETRQIMGDDFWSYGFDENTETLNAFLRYHHQQGLSKQLLKPEKLFAAETLESFKI